MNKNLITILLVFLIPVAVYWTLTKDSSVAILPSSATAGAEIIKFSSPMCYECQELEKIFEEIYPNHSSKISLKKVDVTQQDKITKELIKEYGVTLVPTCIFKNKQGEVIRKTEGSIQPKILDNYMKEQLNG